MSFWNLSNNENAADTGNQFDIPGGNMDPIPAGSSVLAEVDQIKWTSKEDNGHRGPEYVEARWNILAPEEYKGRKIFHKIWVGDHDPDVLSKEDGRKKAAQKKDKALRMLAAMDANAGGRLTQNAGMPNNDQLQVALIGKPMVITLDTWDNQNTGEPGGNWVRGVADKSKELHIAPKKASTGPRPGSSRGGDDFSMGGGYGGGQRSQRRDDDFGTRPAGGYGGGGYGNGGGGSRGDGGFDGGGQQSGRSGYDDEIPF